MTAMLKFLLLGLLLFFILPVAAHAVVWLSEERPPSWREADWSSSGLLPDPRSETEASIRVLSARTGGYKGILAVHTWLVLKHPGEGAYTRYDVVGWGNPVRRNSKPADGRWYSNDPVVVFELKGPEAERLLPKVEAAVAAYQWSERGSYRIWPGPNSNTFVATVLAAVPELGASVPSTAVGRDYQTGIFRTGAGGWTLSLLGVAGVTVGWAEGVQVNFLGLVSGVRFRNFAVILPGFGEVPLGT
jgi:hypothetical protein